MIDLLTVVFRDELPILKVQAQSVDLYCQDLDITSIYVIVNDDPEVSRLIDPSWWGSLASKVQIVHRSIFSIKEFYGPRPYSGWFDQQVLKILGASLSYNHWTWVLDAKTIIIKPIYKDVLVLSSEISRQKTMGWIPAWAEFHQTLKTFFQIELPRAISPHGVPFLFHNNTIREMILTVAKLSGKSFHEWFLNITCPSEFLLYSAYLEYISGPLTDQPGPLLLVANVCHSQFDEYDSIIDRAHNNKTITVSVHRRTWNRITDTQKQKFRNFLLSRNITTAGELQ
jgi:hypothetical protein